MLAGYFVNAYAAAVPALLALYFAYFFRNPHRTIPEDDTALLSPADGKVMSVEEVYEDLYLDKKCRKIVIFLSVFDVHVNRAPLAGTIDFQQYTCGGFRPAYKDGVGYENTLGDTLSHGQLYGMIKFGSCAEVYVGDDVEILVQKGDRVRGGETIIGRIVK